MAPGILVVSEVFPPAIGGSGALLENVYRRLPGRRVRVLADPGPPGTPRYAGPLEVSYVGMRAPDWGVVRPTSLGRHLRVARAIRSALRREPAEVHCARALPEGLSAALALRGRGRYVCWLHGEELGFASTSRELTWLARRVYAGADAVIANSRNSKDLLVRDWGVAESKIHVVYPGVDTERFRPDVDGSHLRARVAREGDVVFLSVGRLQRRKGHDMVLRALAEFRKTVPNVRYVIVGEGPHRIQLEADAAALGVADIVHFIGETTDEDLPRWYAAADVFVLPNRSDGVDFEGFGIVFLEAAASGLPVIGGRSGGVPEAVGEDGTGVLVDGRRVADIREAMATLALDQTRRRRMSTAAAERVRRTFRWDQAATSLDGLGTA